MNINLDPLRNCFEGAVPAPLATCAPDGTPNISYLSQVQYVDREHIALTFQFFNKTRQNVLANPRAQLTVVDPASFQSYRLEVHYLRTETSGALFECMKAKLAGIASHTGMAGVFRLLGADVYRVTAIEPIGSARAEIAPRPNHLPVLRQLSATLSACPDLSTLLDQTLASLRRDFTISHAMILMRDESGQRLYTVASSGYAESGIGSEIPFGAGVIGVAAREQTAIRISYPTAEYAYSAAMRAHSMAHGLDLETQIPLPGLAAPHSQLAVPIMMADSLYGVLFVESTDELRFSYDDEDALTTLANHLAVLLRHWQHADTEAAAGITAAAPMASDATPLRVRHFATDHSIFLDDDYLIKGVAGAIFWRLVQEYSTHGRNSFSNRELRLDPNLALPELGDNLEARLLLLQRRLAERQCNVQMEKTGRGRFRLCVTRPLELLAT